MSFKPFYWNDSPLPMELIYKLKNDIENIEDIDYDKIQEMVDKAIDADVPTEVKTLIDGYIADGTIKKMLEELTSSQITKYSKLNLAREFRDFHRFRNLKPAILNNDSYNANWVQGSTLFRENGITRFIGCYSDNSGVNPTATKYINTMQLISYTNINTTTESNKSSLSFTVGHGNGMTMHDDGYVYIPYWTSYPTATSTERTADYHIARIKADYSSYEVKEFSAFRSMDLASYDGKLYAYDLEHNRIITFDWDTEEVTDVCVITTPFVPNSDITNPLCFDVCDGYMFCMYDNYQLVVYNLTNGKIVWVYELPEKIDGFMLPEIEGIKVFDDGDIYIITQGYCGSKGQCQLTQTSIFKGNIQTNAFRNAKESVTQNAQNIGRVIYVNPATSNTNPNPTGYTTDNAFRYLQEAIDFIVNYDGIDCATIQLNGDNFYDTQITTPKSIIIQGISGTEASERTVIGGIFGVGCKVHLKDIIVRCSAPYTNSANTTARTANAIVRNGKLSAVTTTYNCSATESWYVETSYGVYANDGAIYSQHKDNTITPSDKTMCSHINGSLFFNGNSSEFGGE